MRTVVAGLVLLGVLATPAAAHHVDVDVVSSRADQVSGGDALIRIEARRSHHLHVLRNGADVTDAFTREGRDLVGGSTACGRAATGSASTTAGAAWRG